MRHLLSLLVIWIALAGVSLGQVCVPSTTQTCTANVGLSLPNANTGNWNIPLNQNFNLLDSILSGGATIPGLNISTSAAFLNTQMYLYGQSSINGCNPLTEYQAAQGANTTAEPITGCMTVPSSSTAHQADGGGFFITNSSTSTNAVGVYSQARCLANSTACWGANFVSRDAGGLTTGLTLYGNEIDVNPLSPTTAYSGVTGFLMELNTPVTGVFPGNGAFYVNSSTRNSQWFVGYQTADGSTPTAALIGALDTVGNVGSQPLKFRSFNGGNSFTATIQTTAPGDINLVPATGRTLQVNGFNVASGVAKVDLTAQTAAVGTTTLYAVPSTGAGQYRIAWDAKITTAAGTSSTLGPLTITYTDPDGVVLTITADAHGSAGADVTSLTANTTTTVLLGTPMLLNCKASTNIQYSFGYASNAANAMNYNLHIRLEAM